MTLLLHVTLLAACDIAGVVCGDQVLGDVAESEDMAMDYLG